MTLTSPSQAHILELMSWFSDADALLQWAGPGFRFPFDLTSFQEDLKANPDTAFALVSPTGELLGFGQYYQRLDKCHLGRLVINPAHRGQGLACELIQGISEVGSQALAVKQCSLFVLAHNQAAIRAYQKAGFILTDYPEPLPLANCLYMVSSMATSN